MKQVLVFALLALLTFSLDLKVSQNTAISDANPSFNLDCTGHTGAVTYSVQGLPEGFVVEGNRIVYRGTGAVRGQYPAMIVAKDSTGATDSSIVLLSVNIGGATSGSTATAHSSASTGSLTTGSSGSLTTGSTESLTTGSTESLTTGSSGSLTTGSTGSLTTGSTGGLTTGGSTAGATSGWQSGDWSWNTGSWQTQTGSSTTTDSIISGAIAGGSITGGAITGGAITSGAITGGAITGGTSQVVAAPSISEVNQILSRLNINTNVVTTGQVSSYPEVTIVQGNIPNQAPNTQAI